MLRGTSVFEMVPPQQQKDSGTRSLRRAESFCCEDRNHRGLRHRERGKKRTVIAWVAITSFLEPFPTAVTMLPAQ